MFSIRFSIIAIIPVVTILLMGCKPHSNKEKIIGSWESEMEDTDFKPGNFKHTSFKVLLKFNKDFTLNSQMIRDGKIEGSYEATYDFEKDQRNLVVYREGIRNRKNVAEIVTLTDADLILVDISGSSDTLHLKRID